MPIYICFAAKQAFASTWSCSSDAQGFTCTFSHCEIARTPTIFFIVGKPDELSSLHDTAVRGVKTVVKGTDAFVTGLQTGAKQGGAQGKEV